MMNRYRNKRTGAVIETPAVCSGQDWEQINASSPVSVVEPEREEKKTRKKGK